VLGLYENFPVTVDCIAYLVCGSPLRRVQRAIIDTLYGLNEESYALNFIAPSYSSSSSCVVSFELGVAEGLTFNYLDLEERKRLRRAVQRNPLSLLDLFWVVKYHVIKKERRVPLRFDYQILRFTFTKRNVVLQIFHERGTQRISLEDLVSFLVKRINREIAEAGLKPLKLERLEAR